MCSTSGRNSSMCPTATVAILDVNNILVANCSVLTVYVKNLHTLQVTPNLISRSIDIQ